MKIQLLIAKESEPCSRAVSIWHTACAERELELEIVDVDADPGAELCQGLRLGALPALILDGELRAVGVQTLAEARALLETHDSPPPALVEP